MKDYLFLFIGGEPQKQSPEEFAQHMGRWQAWIKEMEAAGIYKGGEPLEAEARTLSGSAALMTDGPFAEAKEVVGGYVMISAADIDRAAEVAKGCPIYADGGRVEVRPIMKMDQP